MIYSLKFVEYSISRLALFEVDSLNQKVIKKKRRGLCPVASSIGYVRIWTRVQPKPNPKKY